MEKYSKLVVGITVDIQRSDGRVHSAMVSGVNMDTGSLTVEWFEKGETKGKEIEIDQIFTLNPSLLATPKPKNPGSGKRISTPLSAKDSYWP